MVWHENHRHSLTHAFIHLREVGDNVVWQRRPDQMTISTTSLGEVMFLLYKIILIVVYYTFVYCIYSEYKDNVTCIAGLKSTPHSFSPSQIKTQSIEPYL